MKVYLVGTNMILIKFYYQANWKLENLESNDAIEQFSNDCRKTKTKAITATNHDRGK